MCMCMRKLCMWLFLFSYKILKNGEVAWTSSDVLDWYQIPKGRFCVDRELSDGDDDEASGRIVLVGCLEDFIPKINDVSLPIISPVTIFYPSCVSWLIIMSNVINTESDACRHHQLCLDSNLSRIFGTYADYLCLVTRSSKCS